MLHTFIQRHIYQKYFTFLFSKLINPNDGETFPLGSVFSPQHSWGTERKKPLEIRFLFKAIKQLKQLYEVFIFGLRHGLKC